ncbi:hypothetical protein E4U55_006347 [Claviceps digitariae]|nr:hypothetical protein E4U55_006347 [Claviceps digitariae]
MSRRDLTPCYYCGELTSPTIPMSECFGCLRNTQDGVFRHRSASSQSVGTVINGNLVLVVVRRRRPTVGTGMPIPRATGRQVRFEN